MKIIYKVYHKKYTKDDGILIGIERVNEESTNWEYNLVGKDEWTLGTIAINPDKGMLVRKQFITEDVDGELLFEDDNVTMDESGQPYQMWHGLYHHARERNTLNFKLVKDEG